MENVKEN